MAAVLMLFVMLMVPVLDAAPMITAEGPLHVPKTRLVLTNATVGDVKSDFSCPGGETRCVEGYSTCCLHTSGKYACCQYIGANCCSDYESCCETGLVCDDINDRCVKANIRPWEEPFLKK